MWFSRITTTVFTRIKAIVSKKLLSTYPDLNFTTTDIAETEAKFPTVYIKRMKGYERGQDLEGSAVNAMLATFQVEVTDNVSDTRALEIADECCAVMKSMRFQIIGEPIPDNSNGKYRNIARYQRLVGYNDTL